MTRSVPLLVALALLLAGCARTHKHAPAAAAAPHAGTEEVGIASWYGHPYHGRASSSGEIYDMDQLTAAHRTLPFGTIVRVQNLGNDRTVDVRINDRGPFIDGRIIDLSRAAAREIHMIGPGTAKVRVYVMALPAAPPPGYFAVQVGAYKERGNAERQRAQMEHRYGTARLVRRNGGPQVWRVVVGHESTEQDAGALAARLQTEVGHAFVVRVDTAGGDL